MTAFFRSTRILVTTSLIAVVSVSAYAQEMPAHHHQAVATTVGTTDETPFLKENDAAMIKMMNDMAVKPTGDINRDFVEMMIPHHQGALDMAIAYLRYGADNAQLKRIAQEIIVEQQQEIIAMRMALGDPIPNFGAVPTQINPATTATTESSDEETSSDAPAMMMMKPAN